MPDPSIGETAITGAEWQARYRTMRANGAPVIPTRRPAGRRGRIQRWNDAIAAAAEPRAEYADRLDALADDQQDRMLVGASWTIVEHDLSALQAIKPPRGFGRD